MFRPKKPKKQKYHSREEGSLLYMPISEWHKHEREKEHRKKMQLERAQQRASFPAGYKARSPRATTSRHLLGARRHSKHESSRRNRHPADDPFDTRRSQQIQHRQQYPAPIATVPSSSEVELAHRPNLHHWHPKPGNQNDPDGLEDFAMSGNPYDRAYASFFRMHRDDPAPNAPKARDLIADLQAGKRLHLNCGDAFVPKEDVPNDLRSFQKFHGPPPRLMRIPRRYEDVPDAEVELLKDCKRSKKLKLEQITDPIVTLPDGRIFRMVFSDSPPDPKNDATNQKILNMTLFNASFGKRDKMEACLSPLMENQQDAPNQEDILMLTPDRGIPSGAKKLRGNLTFSKTVTSEVTAQVQFAFDEPTPGYEGRDPTQDLDLGQIVSPASDLLNQADQMGPKAIPDDLGRERPSVSVEHVTKQLPVQSSSGLLSAQASGSAVGQSSSGLDMSQGDEAGNRKFKTQEVVTAMFQELIDTRKNCWSAEMGKKKPKGELLDSICSKIMKMARNNGVSMREKDIIERMRRLGTEDPDETSDKSKPYEPSFMQPILDNIVKDYDEIHKDGHEDDDHEWQTDDEDEEDSDLDDEDFDPLVMH